MKQDIFDRIKAGEAVPFADPEYGKIREACNETRSLLVKMNRATEDAEIRHLLEAITGRKIAESVGLFTPFYINYGRNTVLGKNIFINFDCVFLDLGGIEIDDNVMLAPGVKLLSEGHPIEPGQRQRLTAGKIHIHRNVWLGANATVLQGVTIGENSVVAAGALVTADVPPNVVVGGVPAKILKQL